MSTLTKLEQRIAAIEEELAQLKSTIKPAPRTKDSWVDEISGAFESDESFREILRLGRESRVADVDGADPMPG